VKHAFGVYRDDSVNRIHPLKGSRGGNGLDVGIPI
jgi:hypothetical protein